MIKMVSDVTQTKSPLVNFFLMNHDNANKNNIKTILTRKCNR